MRPIVLAAQSVILRLASAVVSDLSIRVVKLAGKAWVYVYTTWVRGTASCHVCVGQSEKMFVQFLCAIFEISHSNINLSPYN